MAAKTVVEFQEGRFDPLSGFTLTPPKSFVSKVSNFQRDMRKRKREAGGNATYSRKRKNTSKTSERETDQSSQESLQPPDVTSILASPPAPKLSEPIGTREKVPDGKASLATTPFSAGGTKRV